MEKPTVIRRCRTLDGVAILIWSDSAVTGVMGVGLYGDRPRGPGQKSLYARAAQLVVDRIPFYPERDIKLLVRTARKAVEQTSLQPAEYLIRSMNGERFRSNGTVVVAVARKSAQ